MGTKQAITLVVIREFFQRVCFKFLFENISLAVELIMLGKSFHSLGKYSVPSGT